MKHLGKHSRRVVLAEGLEPSKHGEWDMVAELV